MESDANDVRSGETPEDGLPPEVDPRRWVVTRLCRSHRDYLIGNPHTFLGRMAVWCPDGAHELAISKSDIIDMSAPASDWVDGYLSGSEPALPDDDGLTSDEWDRAVARYDEKARRFRDEGRWPEDA